MRSEPFPPPRRRPDGTPRLTAEWAHQVLDAWELAGTPPLDGVPLDQVLIAFSIVAGRGPRIAGYIPA